MSPMLGALFVLLIAQPVSAEVKKHYKDSLMAKGEKGVFSIELIPPKEGLTMGVNSLEIILHDATGADVPGARIVIRT